MPPQQIPSGSGFPPSGTATPKKHGLNILVIGLVLVILLLLASISFGSWAYLGRQDYKDNVDQKISDAVTIAVQQEDSKKDNEFTQREKSPLKTYKGPETYGSVSFQYPKTWSGYVVQKDQNATPLSGYFHPDIVADVLGGSAFALRLEIVNHSYDQELKQFDAKAKSGKVEVSAYKAKNVGGVIGSRLTGEVNSGQQDTLILLPLRDKTLKIWTESKQFVDDFDNIILNSLKFVP